MQSYIEIKKESAAQSNELMQILDDVNKVMRKIQRTRSSDQF